MTLNDVLAIFAFVPAALYVLIYSTQRWWANAVGRSTMGFAFAAALALSSSVWRQIADHAPPPWYRTLVFLLVIVMLWAQVGVLIYVIRRKRQAPPAPDDPAVVPSRMTGLKETP